MNFNIKIGTKYIQPDKVYIIAEIGKNYNGDLEIAKRLIEVAAESGVDAVKFQSFRADKLLIEATKKYQHLKETIVESPYAMHKRLELSLQDHILLQETAKKNNLEFISTPEDDSMVDLLEKINVKAYKIASLDIDYFPLLKAIGQTGKPVIMSTGMATLNEIRDAVNTITNTGNNNLILLHCVSNYPPYDENLNLQNILFLQKNFNLPVGYSDHSIGIEACIAAVALGCVVIEKHFTLDKKMSGPDHRISADPPELKSLVASIRRVKNMLGSYERVLSKDEIAMKKKVRRRIIAAAKIEAGKIIKLHDLVFKISDKGIALKYLNQIIGKRVKNTIPKDKLLNFSDLV